MGLSLFFGLFSKEFVINRPKTKPNYGYHLGSYLEVAEGFTYLSAKSAIAHPNYIEGWESLVEGNRGDGPGFPFSFIIMT